MKLTVFNGSPRGTGSNTTILMEKFLKGFSETDGNEYEIVYLIHTQKQDEFAEKFQKSDVVILAFPLYTDAMPGIVKTFIESLAQFKGRDNNPAIGFVTQSGFMEGVHTEALRHYLEKLTKRLNSRLVGVASRGGVEGIQIQPPVMTRKLFTNFYDLGKAFGSTGTFDPEVLARLRSRKRLNATGRLVFRLMSVFKLSDMIWNQMLKKNQTFDKRYDRPYAQ